MVRRVHNYADGGKIVKDQSAEYEKPTYLDAVKDRVGEMFSRKKKTAVAPAPKPQSVLTGGRKAQLDKAIEDAGG